MGTNTLHMHARIGVFLYEQSLLCVNMHAHNYVNAPLRYTEKFAIHLRATFYFGGGDTNILVKLLLSMLGI